MSKTSSFINNVLSAYSKMASEIATDASEYDVRIRLIKHLVEGVLGYSGKDYQAEKKRTDLRVLDENHFTVIVFETKKPTVDIKEERWKEQAFGYTDAFTRFVVLTNGLQLMVWDKASIDELIIDLDFNIILNQERLHANGLTDEEKAQIQYDLWLLTKENLWNKDKYEKFVVSEKIDIRTEDGFQTLVDKLQFVIGLLEGYVLSAFNEYVQGYQIYEEKLRSLVTAAEDIRGNKKLEIEYELEKRNLRDVNKTFIDFHSGYRYWLKLSRREESDESKGVFCKETIYVLLNKLLLFRICEDKHLVTKKLSNNGILKLREIFTHLKDNYQALISIAFEDIKQLYEHVYARSIFDWYAEGNHDLNIVLNRTLYVLNHFHFGNVNRDILGKLYEKYLPKEQRKKLGEYYTPDEVINYILDTIGYSSDKEIEGKDILDPACGSGGFLVKAMNRLIERYENKGLDSSQILDNTIDHVYGFDINPFACQITEMNLLFQIINLYDDAKKKQAEKGLERFNVYQTDSLEIPKAQRELWEFYNETVRRFTEKKVEIDEIKLRKFQFIVMNPPYVHQKGTKDSPKIDYEYRDYIREYYDAVYDKKKRTRGGIKLNLFIPFIEMSINMLKEGGFLGFIVHKNLLKVESYKLMREFILNHCKILEIIDLGAGVFEDVTGETAIIVLQRESKKKVRDRNKIKIVTGLTSRENLGKDDLNEHHLVQSYFCTTVDNIFSIYVDDKFDILRTKIERRTRKLGNITRIVSFGLNTTDNKKYVSNTMLTPDYKKSVMGRDISKYYITNRNRYVLYDEEILSRIGDEEAFLSDEKLVMQRIGSGLITAYDDEQFYCFNSINMILPKDQKFTLKYILAILNSDLMNLYFRQRFAAFAKLTVNVTQGYLSELPIRVPSEQQQKRIVKLVDTLLYEYKKQIRYNVIIEDMESLIEDYKTIKLSETPSTTFEITCKKIEDLQRDGKTVHLSLVDSIKCNSVPVAKYVFYWLKSNQHVLEKTKNLKKQIFNIIIPQDLEDLKKLIQKFERVERESRKIPNRLKRMEESINNEIFKLYGLSKIDISVVKRKIKSK